MPWASLVAQNVKKLSAMQETQVWSLGQEDPIEKGIVTHSTIPAWRILCIEEPGGIQSMGLQRAWHDWATNTYYINEGDLGSSPGLGRSPGEGNGNPLQYSCLENPMDGGAW